MPPSKNFPAIQWAANDRAITFLLIGVLQNYPLLNQNIWPALGDKIQGKKKSQTYQSLAERVLEGQDEYLEAFRTPEGRKAYGTSVKDQILQMEKKWREARKMLGVTGAELDSEATIWEGEKGDKLRNLWHEVQKFCPYYYALKPPLGEHLRVTDHAITNSTDVMDTSSLLRSRSRIAAEIEAGSEEDEDRETDIALDPALRPSSTAITPADPSVLFAPLAGSSTLVTLSAGPSAPVVPLAGLDNPLPGSGLRRKNGGYADFAETFRGITEAATSQKRQRDLEKHELRRYKVQNRFEKEDRHLKRSLEAKERHSQRNLDLEMRRLDLQERELEVREKEATRYNASANGEGKAVGTLFCIINSDLSTALSNIIETRP